MDDTNNSELFTFDSPLNQPTYIKVIGVGGGGNNAVNHMFRKGITGVDFIVSNTDMKALNGSPVPNKFVLGKDGLGAGGRPERARRAAEEKAEEIKELFSHNTKMIFITAGMGGGTGTGAAPVIARIAKEIKLQAEEEDDPGQILVVAVVTTPFMFEGNRRLQQAQAGVEELSKYVDSILVINNEKLRSYGNLCMSDAFSMANDVLLTAVKSIAEIITLNAYVTIDFRDVNTVMEHSGTAIMGIGTGKGENRARQAIEQAATSVLLNDSDIQGAKNVLLYFSYGPDHEITMDEMGEIADYITEHTGSRDTNVIWGTGTDEALDDEVKITLIATGFEQSGPKDGVVITLTEDKPKEKPTRPVNNITEPTIIRRTDPVAPSNDNLGSSTDWAMEQRTHVTNQAPLTPQRVAYQAPVAEPLTVASPLVAEQPTNEVYTAPENRHVIPLYGEEEAEVRQPKKEEEPLDEGIRLVSRTTTVNVNPDTVTDSLVPPTVRREAPVMQNPVMTERPVATAPVNTEMPIRTPGNQAARTPYPTRLDIETMNRAERIKAMHDLLRNDINGAQIVESMNPMDMTGEKLYETVHSSESEASKSSVDANGVVKQNSFLFVDTD